MPRRLLPLPWLCCLFPLALATWPAAAAAETYQHEVELALDFGASIADRGPLAGLDEGPPVFLGLTAGYAATEWLLLEGFGGWLANDSSVVLLAGPRLRTGYYPISASLGLKAGAVLLGTGLRFNLAPEVGAEMRIGGRGLLGLGYAVDFVPGDPVLYHRVYLRGGYWFY